MRVGIIGQGPFAIELAYQISRLGGSVVLFAEKNLELLWPVTIDARVSGNLLSFDQFTKEHLQNKIEEVQKNCDIYRFSKVKRTHKKLLHKKESFEDRGRLADLFRIIYTLDPTENVLKQVKDNPEIFQKLGDDVVNSLKESVEMAEDVDIVVDARERFFYRRFSGVNGLPILNELRWKKYIHYRYLSQSEINEIKGKTIVISNDSHLSSYVEEILLQRWEKLNRVILLAEPKWYPKLMEQNEKKWEIDVDHFHQKMNHWKSLEDYEKVKIPKPAEPSKKVFCYPDMRAMSVDKLLDRDEFFVTAELYEPESDKLQTYGVDSILSFNAFTGTNSIEKSNEPGYFIVSESFIRSSVYQFDLVKDQIQQIVNKLLQYFSKA